ncbi:MAG: efflux RND transporter periplasmic adaptor subunit [Fibrobacteraceae bacterium]|nr:efflux RND transporter periplasmic adaptor subunit [Fibrobacteraceae bacterium]
MMKKWLKIIGFLGVLVVALLGVRIFLTNESLPKYRFVYETVAKRDLRTSISATGTLEPVDQVEIGTQVSGDIAKIHVDFNNKVKKGQILAELDKSKLKATLAQAEISLYAAENDYSYKKKVLERIQKLSENGSASAVELENAEYDFRSAELSLKRAKNEVAVAKLNLSYCVIKSPIDGVVLERSVDVGQTVAASMSAPTLFILAKDLSRMRVMASVDEADIGSVQSGQSVEFYVDAFIDEVFYGTVKEVRLNPVTTSNVVTYTVVIEAENPKHKLLPGMTATCTIVTQEKKDVLSISVKSLKFRPNTPTPPMALGKTPSVKMNKSRKESRVFSTKGEKIYPLFLKTGISDGVYTEVLEGLSEGDSVLVAEELIEMQKENNSTKEKSPFMPGPRGNKKR